MLKYPYCKYCRRLRDFLPDSVSDEMIDRYHESKIGWEDFPKEVQDIVIQVMGGDE